MGALKSSVTDANTYFSNYHILDYFKVYLNIQVTGNSSYCPQPTNPCLCKVNKHEK